jgi:hypothetical protein
MNVAIFTDNDFDKVNGVTTSLRAVLKHAPEGIRPRIYTASDIGVDEPEAFVPVRPARHAMAATMVLLAAAGALVGADGPRGERDTQARGEPRGVGRVHRAVHVVHDASRRPDRPRRPAVGRSGPAVDATAHR